MVFCAFSSSAAWVKCILCAKHCLRRAFQNQPSKSFPFPLLSLMLQPGLQRVHSSLAVQKTRRYSKEQEEDRGEARGGASVAPYSSGCITTKIRFLRYDLLMPFVSFFEGSPEVRHSQMAFRLFSFAEAKSKTLALSPSLCYALLVLLLTLQARTIPSITLRINRCFLDFTALIWVVA